MEIGLTEVLLIGAIVIGILNLRRKKVTSKASVVVEDSQAPRRSKVQLLGLFAILGGLLLLIISFELMKGASMGVVWGTAAVVAGVIIFIISSLR